MEKPYQGRAIVENTPASVKIIIPVKRNFATLFFIGFLLLNLSVGIVVICFGMSEIITQPIILLPFGIMLTPYVFVFRALWLILKGKEIIEVSDEAIYIERPSLFFRKPKTYNLQECINFRVQESLPYPFGTPLVLFAPLVSASTGLIIFDYGMKDVKFGSGIAAAEGRYILSIIKNRGFIAG
jgi:hypothetical protein